MMKPKNLLDMVAKTVDRFSDKDALMYKSGAAYQSITYGEMWRQVKEAAAGLAHLGIGFDDKVALLSENNPMWPISDLAIASIGAVSVPIYPTQTAEQTAYILKNADCRGAIVENKEQLRKIRSTEVELEFIVLMKPEAGFSDGDRVLSFDSLRKEGVDHPLPGWEQEWQQIDGDQLVTIIHTSGTTGPPKGVMLSHNNFISNTEGVNFWVIELVPEDVTLSYLPLSHVFERMAGQFVPLKVGATIAYAEGIDQIEENLLEVRPTVLTSVPRLFEKVHARVQEQIESGTPLRKKIFNWAVDVGRQRYEHLLRARVDQLVLGDPLPPQLKRKFELANRLVFQKIKDRLGGNLRGMVSGGAPLNPEITDFFWSVDMPVLEGYGLTETSPVIASNPMLRPRIGSVGRPLPNLEVKIAEDGEILVKGPSVMKGYYKNEEATAKTIQKGWLHTGDLGELDEDGYLKVVDRKKNILVLATGKNVAPQPVENAINNSPYIENSVLIGNGRKFVISLVVPDYENLLPWAKKQGLPEQDPENLAGHPKVQALLESEVKRLTKGFAAFEQPKQVKVCAKEWTVDSGELTPTLKVRLKVVEEKYADLIEEAYADAQAAATNGQS